MWEAIAAQYISSAAARKTGPAGASSAPLNSGASAGGLTSGAWNINFGSSAPGGILGGGVTSEFLQLAGLAVAGALALALAVKWARKS